MYLKVNAKYEGEFDFHQCVYIYKDVDQKGLTAILVTQRLVGVTPAVNLRVRKHTWLMWGINPVLET